MIPRRASLDAPGASQVARDGAANGARVPLAAQQDAQVGRLEGHLLVVLAQRRLDLGQSRRSAGCHEQFVGLVTADPR